MVQDCSKGLEAVNQLQNFGEGTWPTPGWADSGVALEDDCLVFEVRQFSSHEFIC
jgi:hypothetical protein